MGINNHRTLFERGGVIAGVILIVFGAGALAMSVSGFMEVRSNLAQEGIVGTPDSSIAGQKVDTGAEAREFSAVMRKHTLAMTGGQTYAEMGRFIDEAGVATHDESKAAIDPETGKPVENGLRQVWVTQTALATALNMSFLAERVALFGMAVGGALLLSGIGFLVLVRGGALKTAAQTAARRSSEHGKAAQPVA